MGSVGYDGMFFRGANQWSGTAIFWRRSAFQLDDVASRTSRASQIESIDLGDSHREVVYNYDMQESRHSIDGLGSPAALLPKIDRKNLGMVRLRHIASNMDLWVICVHLMTMSRDNSKCTPFPGEVRAKELQFLGKCVRRHVSPSSRLIIAGDFNIDSCEVDILRGALETPAGKLSIPTGFACGKADGAPWQKFSHFDWRDNINGTGTIAIDAFESLHRNSASEQSEHATSQSPVRRKWIDYILYSYRSLLPVHLSDTRLPHGKLLPSTDEPSDHIPIAARFQILAAMKSSM